MFLNYAQLCSYYGRAYKLAKVMSHTRTYCVFRYDINQKWSSSRRLRQCYGCNCQKSVRSYFVRNWKSESQGRNKLLTKHNGWLFKSAYRKFSSDFQKSPMDPKDRKLYILLIIFSVTFSVIFLPKIFKKVPRISFNTFVEDILKKGEVHKIRQIEDHKVLVYLKAGAIINNEKYNSGGLFIVEMQEGESFEEKLRAVEESLGIPSDQGVLIVHNEINPVLSFISLLILLFMLGLFYMLFKMGIKFTLMKPMHWASRAKFTLIDPMSGDTKGVKFSDVCGLKEAKVEIMEFVDYLKNPDHYRNLGAKVPKGALLLGPPGCGKTLLAKAVASEAYVPFLSMNGSEFVDPIGGLGAAKMRNLFSEARKISPCIIYIDEIDAVGRKREGKARDTSEGEHTLNQLLVEMDGITTREWVVMLASTNRPEVLDSALLRPGRFDRHIMIDLPTAEERREIFEHYLKSIRLEHEPENYSKRLASLTPGFSGADIANICNEAALHAVRLQKGVVKGDDFEYAIERVVGGIEKRSSTVSQEEKRMVAYHEAGRALIGWLSEYGDILLKMSVLPRTHQAVGWSRFSSEEKYLFSEQELFEKMVMSLGGRAAETLIFNKISTRSTENLKLVQRIAYSQVRLYGMNKIVGPVSFDHQSFQSKPYSKQLASIIDEEARKLVAKAFFSADVILRENKEKLIKLAETLLQRETMNYQDMVDVVGPPVKQNKKRVEPLAFDLSVDMAAGPEPPKMKKE